MDCSFRFSSTTQHLLQPDEEQLDPWKDSRRPRSRYHRGEHNLSPVHQGYQGSRLENLSPVRQGCRGSRLEPLECRDLLVQNALFTGDLEMVQKYFTKSAAINLIIETRGAELHWTSRKRGGCAQLGHGGVEVPRIGTRERAQTPEKSVERNPQCWRQGGGRSTWEERLLGEERGSQGCRTNGSRLVEGGQRQICWEMVRTGSLEGVVEKNTIRTVLLEIAGIDVKYVRGGDSAWVRKYQVT